MPESVEIAIIGAGQAGLALSYELRHAGVEHLILERGAVAESWRKRWDSFRLVIPNWSVQLPGGAYDGDDPDGFMARDEIVDFLGDYARSFHAPVRAGVEVSEVSPREDGGHTLHTSGGEIRARDVVLASGGYQRPNRPAAASQLATGPYIVIDAEDYTNPAALPPGDVLVVGSGQTGCQLAEECLTAGRTVYLACGRAPWFPRRLEGRDAVSWILDTDFFEARLADLPDPGARFISNPQFSGHHGGCDVNFRTLQDLGVNLLGHFTGADAGKAFFAPDLHESVAFGDDRYRALRELVAASCVTRGLPAPAMPDPPLFEASPAQSLDLRNIGTIMFTTGFRPDYTSWVKPAEAFDSWGFPIQLDGSSTVVGSMHFMGVHFQRKRKSATLFGVAEDAAVLAERLASPERAPAIS